MTINKIIKDITEEIDLLNEAGIELACVLQPHNFELAIRLHNRAAAKSKEAGAELNPDYYAFSIANKIYAERHKFNDRRNALSLLEKTLKETDDAFSGREHKTFFGRARLFEEMALVIRYAPDEKEFVSDMEIALQYIGGSMRLYAQAIDNQDEIVSPESIRNRLHRVTGIAAILNMVMAERTDGEKRNGYLTDAMKFAQSELDLRLKAGEGSGFDLANSYHTVAVVQSEYARDHIMYEKAKQNLLKAMELDKRPESLSVLLLRFAWLEYRSGRDSRTVIQNYFESVLDDQNDPKAKWSEADLAGSRGKFFELGKYLGGTYIEKVEALFRK